MRPEKTPITDDHIHIDPVNGRGIEAAKDFMKAGGTHMFLVSKPSFSLGISPRRGSDFCAVFDETLRIADKIRETGLVVYPVLGVHPAEITRLSESMTYGEASVIMKEGLDFAARYVTEGTAVAIKSGRPHYDVTPEVAGLSNEVLFHAFQLGRDCRCAVQVHAETGPCEDMVGMAGNAGMDPARVVKHYASPETPLLPSLMAKHEAIPILCREGRRFTMESDYMDENSRPGAVIGPKSVPRFTNRLLSEGLITMEDVHRIHTDTPSRVYGVEIVM
ncbi:MAG: TatD family hydrolase [Methanoregulaceae archaeon]|jgi:TatD-related deoxyribonuclease|nr:TatD family hydrolase [Methanoregulaceae archaeon]